jgi:hypothetical protein
MSCIRFRNVSTPILAAPLLSPVFLPECAGACAACAACAARASMKQSLMMVASPADIHRTRRS